MEATAAAVVPAIGRSSDSVDDAIENVKKKKEEKKSKRSLFSLSLSEEKKMPLQSPPPASDEEPSPRPSTSSFPGSTKDDCERFVDNAVERDPTVKFMMDKLGEVSFFYLRP